jgi:GNAT superfamily N-acetyltransferase
MQVSRAGIHVATAIFASVNLVAELMPTRIRPAEEADVPAMASIRAREWETEAYWLDRIGNYLRGEDGPKQSLPARAVFVALERTEVIGFVAGHRTRRFGCDGELEWVNVVEENRGHGIACKLLQQMAAWFVEHDALRICVDVDPKNLAAWQLYSKFGAKPLRKHWMVWEDARLIGKAGPAD